MPNPKKNNFKLIQEILKNDGIIAYPTETVYGLGCNPFSKNALEKVFALKGRKLEQTPIVLIPNEQWLHRFAKDITPTVRYFTKKYWPGGLTLVLTAAPTVPNWLLRDDETIALRISSHPWVKEFMTFSNTPLISTSANVSHDASSLTLAQVKTYFPTQIDYCVDGGTLAPSRGSTIVRISQTQITLMREGDVPFKQLSQEFHGHTEVF